MSHQPSDKITILLSLDRDILPGYYNQQDNAPLYKRQLSPEFEDYILKSARGTSRNSKINFRISYSNETDKEYAEPLLSAIRKHFSQSRSLMTINFENFKRRAFKLLLLSLSIVTIAHGVLPFLLKGEEGTIHTGLTNSLDVFSWVILWKPIDRLIFYWNPFLKDIGLFGKLEKAELVLEEIEE